MSIIKCVYTDSALFEYKVDQQQTERYQLHSHNYYEIYYYISGNVSYIVEGKRYNLKPNTLLLLPPNAFHGVKIESSIPYVRYVLNFSPELISLDYRDILLSLFNANNCTYFEDTENLNIKNYLDNIADACDFIKDVSDAILKIRIEKLLTQLLFNNSCEKKHLSNDSASDTVVDIINYLNNNFVDDISLDEISTKFYISKHHLNNVFRATTGTTVSKYLIYKRVANARKLLSNGVSANVAAVKSGFRDYSVFFKAYKKTYGCSPSNDKLLK